MRHKLEIYQPGLWRKMFHLTKTHDWKIQIGGIIVHQKREPACITTVNAGNTVMIVTAFFSEAARETAADKMARVLDLEAVWQEQDDKPLRTS